MARKDAARYPRPTFTDAPTRAPIVPPPADWPEAFRRWLAARYVALYYGGDEGLIRLAATVARHKTFKAMTDQDAVTAVVALYRAERAAAAAALADAPPSEAS